MRASRKQRGHIRLLIALAATVAVVAPVAFLWQDSLLPDEYTVTGMGKPDYGGGPRAHGHAGHTGRVVDAFTERSDGPADVRTTLVAREETFRLASGEPVHGYTLNGTSPGPTIRARQGQLLEIQLRNESVSDGTALHWHGIDVPNAMDGVAGVTQDAVPVGGEFTYRFRAEQAGTYWYHSHQRSHEQVPRGLYGAVVITPRSEHATEQDVVAAVHLYGGRRTVNGHLGDAAVDAGPGRPVRVRVINTDNGPMPVWVSGGPYRVVAVDGTEVNRPGLVSGAGVLVTAGGRADLLVEAPARVEMGGSAALVLGTGVEPERKPERMLDLLSYGEPAPLNLDVSHPDRRFEYAIGRSPGFVRGKPGMWWTVNGEMYPDMPMFMVAEGDVVRVRISNSSGEVHPVHPHGHHMVVLARDGVPASGSPWWVDSLNVADGESYDIAFLADNPGAWMYHCHHLGHAADGFVTHLMYEGVRTPYLMGQHNEPE